jgi:hypothetical protein
MTSRTSIDELIALLTAYIQSDPRLEIWRDYPDISEADDAYTDGWACEEISREFTAFARQHDWDLGIVAGADPGVARKLHLTPRAKVALDIAIRCAGRLDATSTGTGHLLYGLAAEREGLAARVLRIHRITPTAIDGLLVPLPATG